MYIVCLILNTFFPVRKNLTLVFHIPGLSSPLFPSVDALVSIIIRLSILNKGATWTSASDSAVSVVSTAAATDHAAIQVKTFNADGNPTPESVTATVTGAATVGIGAAGASTTAVKATVVSAEYVRIDQATAGAPATGTVTIQFNGVTVGSPR